MTEKPPTDLAEHAVDFGRRRADRLDEYAATRMEELGIPSDQIGASDHERGIPWRVFFPDEIQGGGVSPGKRLNVDSGVLNPSHMDHLGPDVGKAWGESSLRDRFDSVIAHEFEEAERGAHEEAVEHAPDMVLPVTHASRDLSRKIRGAERGR